MATNFTEVITTYRKRCEQLLQNTEPDSAEYIAYSQILQVFDRYQTGEPGNRAGDISMDLGGVADSMQPVFGAPAEDRAKIAKARKIAEQWAQDFKRDSGNSGIQFRYRYL